MRLTRRQFLRAATALVAAGAGTGAYARWIEPHWLGVEHRALPIAKLPAALAGRSLVQISDLHVGPIVDDAYLIAALRRVNALRPDVLAITGDFMTCHGSEEIDHTLRILRHLEPAKLATLAVLGNHDYGEGRPRKHVGDQLARRLREHGINVLQNEVADVSGLHVGGVDDLWNDNYAPARMFAQLPDDAASLLLVHNPDAVDGPQWQRYRGWTLAGHTHGGQCRLPWVGPLLLPVKNKRYVQGAYDLPTGGRLYINPGVGYLRRVRFGARPQITAFTLTQAS